jgi:hypothetical protein
MKELIQFLQGLLPELFLRDPTSTFSSGVPDAIGIIIQPKPHTGLGFLTLATTNPEQVANLWGHTALFFRRNGRIVGACGFDPNRLAMALDVLPEFLGGNRISSGRGATPGVYYDERRMFRSPDMIVVEFSLAGRENLIDQLLVQRPRPGHAQAGTHPGLLQQYVTHDGENCVAFDRRVMGNCLSSIIQILTRVELVISPSVQQLDRRGRILGAPDHDVSVSQGLTTQLVLRGARNRELRLHDLRTGAALAPTFQGRAMRLPTRVGRRIGTAVSTFGAARLPTYALMRLGAQLAPSELVAFFSGTAISNLAVSRGYAQLFTAVPENLQWEWACAFKVLLGILVESLPSDNLLWRLPLDVLDDLLSAIVKAGFLYALYLGNIDAWIWVVWLLGSFLLAILG